METKDQEYRQFYWRSHRGMLELDDVLLNFLAKYYPQMTSLERKSYAALLEESDPTLYQWLILGKEVDISQFEAIVNRIREQVCRH